jgi:hypothetical protein
MIAQPITSAVPPLLCSAFLMVAATVYSFGARYGDDPHFALSPHFKALYISYGEPGVEMVHTIEVRIGKPMIYSSDVGCNLVHNPIAWLVVDKF